MEKDTREKCIQRYVHIRAKLGVIGVVLVVILFVLARQSIPKENVYVSGVMELKLAAADQSDGG